MTTITEKSIARESSISAGGIVFCAAVVPRDNSTSFPIYWLKVAELDSGSPDFATFQNQLAAALEKILVDPILEDMLLCEISKIESWGTVLSKDGNLAAAVKQFMPGVTDNLAHIVEEALELEGLTHPVKVASGRMYLSKVASSSPQCRLANAEYKLFHPVIERFERFDLTKGIAPDAFPTFPTVSLSPPEPPQPININLTDEELIKLSRERLLALTLTEMKAIQKHYAEPSIQQDRLNSGLPVEPTDVELEVIAQTWSEHCKHKIFNANVTFRERAANGKSTSLKITSLYKSFIQKATSDLAEKRTDLLSVFSDNSGVVDWDDKHAVCFKVETHNSPSALEPYGGSLTGILGVNRDILGTGLGAKPIFNTDVLCFAYPSDKLPQRPKLLPPETIMTGVRKGIQDGGNKSGIPTVNGAVFFDDRYRAKPLVFCGTGGILPKQLGDLVGYKKYTKPGDIVVMAGGRVGKDGVHGATFSSESLHEGSPVTAVQIGDPFTQKRLIDFTLEARDAGLITGLTDNGAGGLSSSVGEMAEQTGGVRIDLANVPTKYAGLNDWEIVVSESQERMTIATDKLHELEKLARKHHVEISAIGVFDTCGKFEIARAGRLIGSLPLEFLHKGVPVLELDGEWHEQALEHKSEQPMVDLKTALIKLLAHPNIASKEFVIRQYDHEVQARSVVKPLMGKRQNAPCDAAVITPVLGDSAGLAIANGLAPRLSEVDPYLMALSAVDEAVRNLVCVGADPKTISLLDNFCWPDPVHSEANKRGKEFMGMLVKACQGLYDAVIAFEAPLISGKDSMKNDFDDGVIRLSVPPTLLISAIARVPSIERSVTMEFKDVGDTIFLLHAGKPSLKTSHLEEIFGTNSESLPTFDLTTAQSNYQKLHQLMRQGLITSAHDLSEGGLAVALAECSIGSGLGANIIFAGEANDFTNELFGEGPGRIIFTVSSDDVHDIRSSLGADIPCLGVVTENAELQFACNEKPELNFSLPISTLESAWKTELPFQ